MKAFSTQNLSAALLSYSGCTKKLRKDSDFYFCPRTSLRCCNAPQHHLLLGSGEAPSSLLRQALAGWQCLPCTGCCCGSIPAGPGRKPLATVGG